MLVSLPPSLLLLGSVTSGLLVPSVHNAALSLSGLFRARAGTASSGDDADGGAKPTVTQPRPVPLSVLRSSPPAKAGRPLGGAQRAPERGLGHVDVPWPGDYVLSAESHRMPCRAGEQQQGTWEGAGGQSRASCPSRLCRHLEWDSRRARRMSLNPGAAQVMGSGSGLVKDGSSYEARVTGSRCEVQAGLKFAETFLPQPS